ncbi:phosphoesterase [Pontibacter diazotrophicus]|uniref:Phosphoesterase n=1 Tax=Pontibacter diazotrophicus TaxID=1400979 RepID=A0A3D8LGR5_9BACT|nr:metallophosphoesterase [Pontibacter diazotrophicus]RDV16577.1 phosphoesterase [Pontibacter diazotrophicus]
MYDIIGDIHGHADALEQLLQKLGYDNSKGYYSHPERKVIFVGDYIDRGPKIRETLEIVRAMADNKTAIALMGNHELNAILYNTKGTDGEYLREHSTRNVSQHAETAEQFKGRGAAYNNYIEWFKTLPLYHEEENLRAVHACWDKTHIQYLRDNLTNDRLTDNILLHRYKEDSRLTEAIEVTLKGKELPMPSGLTFQDKDGYARSALRIKWWLSPKQLTYRQYSIGTYDTLSDEIVPEALVSRNKPYSETEKPVFFGHYWLSGNTATSVYGKNVCCVDYSVAKAGKLVAYRWQGERCLHHGNIHYVTPSEL